MERAVMAVRVDQRSERAPRVQEVLTRHGCTIEARLGLNPGCSDTGLLLLVLVGDSKDIANLEGSLSSMGDVSVQTMHLNY